MKLTKATNLLVLGLVLMTAASGCKKKPGYVTPLPQQGMTGDKSDIGQGGKIGTAAGRVILGHETERGSLKPS